MSDTNLVQVNLTENHVRELKRCLDSFVDQISELFYLEREFVEEKIQEHLGKYSSEEPMQIRISKSIDVALPDNLVDRSEELQRDFNKILDAVEYRKEQNYEELLSTLTRTHLVYEQICNDNGKNYYKDSDT